MNTVTAATIPGDALRDSRHAWRRAMFRADQRSAGAAASPKADAAPAPTFAERALRVAVPGAAPTSGAGPDAADADLPTFAEQMKRVVVARPTDPMADADANPREAARAAAEKMVSSLFVQPLLDMALKSDAEGPFAPSQGEKTFRPLLNQRLADEIVHKSDMSLVNAIVDRMVADREPDSDGHRPGSVALEPRHG
jgi:hypothetical protein